MLGRELWDEILVNFQEYFILDQVQYFEVYVFLQDIVDDILGSGEVKYVQDFVWEVYIIDDLEMLNVFVVLGGYIFVYMGLIKFLEEKDDFVGVMGYEIVYVDLWYFMQQFI